MPMDNEQEGGTSRPSMKRCSSNSSPMPLPELTRLEEPQDSIDTGARGPDAPRRRGVLDTLAQQRQEAKRADI
eukprot:159950-Alexandrium_andersonii.AAC.1